MDPFSKYQNIYKKKSVNESISEISEDFLKIDGVVLIEISFETQNLLNFPKNERLFYCDKWFYIEKKLIENHLNNTNFEFTKYKNSIEKYTNDSILIGMQDELKNNFIICLTTNAEMKMSNLIKKMKLERNKKVKILIEKYPKTWNSMGSETEVDAFHPIKTRKMFAVELKTRKSFLNNPIHYSDADFYDYFEPKEINFKTIRRLQVSTGVQVKPTTRDQSALHVPPFPKNQGTQYEMRINLTNQYDEELKNITTNFLKTLQQLH